MKQYTKIKESHVTWIGSIPNEWKIEPLKFHAKINEKKLNEKTNPDQEISYIDIGNVHSDGTIDEPEKLLFEDAPSRARRIVHENDTIISTVRTYLKAISFIDKTKDRYICSTGFAVITPSKNLEPKFLYWYLCSPNFIGTIMANSVGVAYPAINAIDIGQFPCVFPNNKQEQESISKFLDVETTKIDSEISKNLKLIKLLKEKKQATIDHVVTKGLNPETKMNPSGIKWLKKIPKGWKIIPIKYLCTLITDGSHYSPERLNEGYSMATVENMEKNSINIDTCHKIDKHNYDVLVSSKCQPKINDVLFSKDGTIGNSIVFTQSDKIVLLSSIAIIRTKELLDPFYCNFILQSNFLKFQYNRLKEGAALKRIILEKIINFKILFPSLEEQEQISNYLKQKISKIDLIISQSISQIQKLQEFRDSLISKAVTGKIDVRCA